MPSPLRSRPSVAARLAATLALLLAALLTAPAWAQQTAAPPPAAAPTPAPPVEPPPPASVAPTIAEAEKLVEDKKFAEAVALVEARLKELGAGVSSAERRALEGRLGIAHLFWADYFRKQSAWQSALKHNQASYEAYKQDYPSDASVALNNIGIVYINIGEPQRALQYYEQALTIQRAVSDRQGEARTLSNIGMAYVHLGELRRAAELFAQSLPLRRAVNDRVGEAATLMNMGGVYGKLGEPRHALELFEQSLPLQKSTGDREGEAASLHNMGQIFYDQGEPRRALEYFERSLQLKRIIGDRRGVAISLNDVGIIYDSLGERRRALASFEQALPLLRATGDRSNEATTLNNIGGLYSKLGEENRAMKVFKRVLPLRRAMGDRAGEANTLVFIGSTYDAIGEGKNALEYYEQALLIQRAIGTRREEANTLSYIGLAYSRLGQFQRALEYYEKSLPIQRAIEHRRGEATVLTNIASLYDDMGEQRRALDLYGQVLPLWRAMSDRDAEQAVFGNLTWLWYGKNRRDTIVKRNPILAAFWGKMAIDTSQSLRGDVRGMDKQLQQSLNTKNNPSHSFLAFLLAQRGRNSEAVQVLERGRQEDYLTFSRNGAQKAADTVRVPVTLTPREKRWAGELDRQGSAFAEASNRVAALQARRERTPDEEAQLKTELAAVDAAQKEYAILLRRIEADFAEAGKRTPTDEDRLANTPEADTLQAMLKRGLPGTAAVFVQQTGDAVVTILVTAYRIEAHTTSAPIVRFNTEVAAFRAALTDPDRDPRPRGKVLYDQILKPLEPALARAKANTLLFSVDGALASVPVAALWDGKRYVAQKWRTAAFVPGNGALVRLARKPASGNGKGVLIAGVADPGASGLARLPGARAEALAIARVMPGAPPPLLDGAFTSQSLRSALGNPARRPAVVHLASHFALQPSDNGDGDKSFLLLGGGARLTLADFKALPDGLLDGIDLLTLSACDTAGGAGLANFSALCRHKGADAVLASLWPVADASTASLMARFYRNWRGAPGVVTTKAQALRQAQLALLGGDLRPSNAPLPKKRRGVQGARTAGEVDNAASAPPFPYDPRTPYAHPYYWAPFILIGNPR